MIYKYSRGYYVTYRLETSEGFYRDIYGKVLDVNPEKKEAKICWVEDVAEVLFGDKTVWMKVECDRMKVVPFSQALYLIGAGIIPNDL